MPFTEQTLQFLTENRLRDSKEWFNEHKEDYRRLVLEPMQELVGKLTPTMLDIDPQFTTEPKVDKTICRIWRDTRYSKDKSRYRENMWLIFKRGKMHGTQVPGLYFEISPSGFCYGGGFYSPSTDYMNTLRKLILEGDAVAKKAMKAYKEQSVFTLEGEKFKRPRYPNAPEEQRRWLELRGIHFEAESRDAGLLFSDALADKLCEDFRHLAPIYQFLLHTSQILHEKELQRPALL
ncbi:DUF2461 domain-containing protein [Zongyangia hominis]|uniref:DUF2461 domain-containing protein n=1 Tax=Zongyangia hominis TaxID=2763677 RepID=A0A926IB92_9FIRM|nr:DUF2461 domain-containing protein [Zongyangia hominis]MBC8569880.1 DUF2461 domain-containing protein [Zongyangia hominis]